MSIVQVCHLPEDEVGRMDEERRHHPLGSQKRPCDVALVQQEEEGDQVRQNIRQPKNHIEKCEFYD